MNVEQIKKMMDACYLAKRVREMLPKLPQGVAPSYIQYLDVIQKLDASAASLPLSYTTKGALRKGSSVASPQRFRLLNAYVKKKITEVQDSILTGKADASPYEIGNKNACTYCAYQGSCGFDRKIPGYEFRRLKQFADEEVWKNFEQEAE